MRRFFVVMHRWLGLFTALFLALAGLTGSIIAWDHELDAWLNPGFYKATAQDGMETPKTPLVLAQAFERQYPDLRIQYMPLSLIPNEAFMFMVEARNTSSKKPLTFNQVSMNPYTGEIQGTRYWGKFSIAKENLIPFIYKLHYSLHLPDWGGLQCGVLLMGIIGILWFFDSFIALGISFPKLVQWRKSFKFRWQSGSAKLTFDLHRSGGVWVWLLVLMMAFTSISMNLGPQVVRPLVSYFSEISPSPFELKKLPNAINNFSKTREQIIQESQKIAQTLTIKEPVGALYYASVLDLYGIGFFNVGAGHGDSGLGNVWLYIDGDTGKYLSGTFPGKGTAGDLFLQTQFPLHSGRILGITGRILISLLGLIITMLSITGIIIWWRKYRARWVAGYWLRSTIKKLNN